VTEELIDPTRNIPRALFISIPIIILCYLLANISFFAVMRTNELVDYEEGVAVSGFATIFGEHAMGIFGSILYPIVISLCAFGSIDGTAFVGMVPFLNRMSTHVLTASRVVYASATRGDFPKTFARLYGHKAPVPLRALVFEGDAMRDRSTSLTSHRRCGHGDVDWQ
jgi:L-type amino acid transporter 9